MSDKIIYYSQINQDKLVIQWTKEKREGYFVELGAYDGIKISNTLTLETFYDWKGICIEPSPTIFQELVKNRSSSKCKCYNNLVYDTSGEIVNFIEHKKDPELSGTELDINCYKNIIISSSSNVIHKLKTITLTEILNDAEAPKIIDYLSLDTEGSEYKILLGLDLSKYTVSFLTIEHNNQEPNRSLIRKHLENNGYKFIESNHSDDNYMFLIGAESDYKIL